MSKFYSRMLHWMGSITLVWVSIWIIIYELFSEGLALGTEMVMLGSLLVGGLGIAQWIYLRGRINNSAEWLVGAVVGGGIGGLLANYLRQFPAWGDFHTVPKVTLGLVIILPSTVYQFRLLNQWVKKAAWWIPANMLAFAWAFLVSPLETHFGILVIGDQLPTVIINSIYGGLVCSFVTGIALSQLPTKERMRNNRDVIDEGDPTEDAVSSNARRRATAVDELKIQLAKGEITIEEYDVRLEELGEKQ